MSPPPRGEKTTTTTCEARTTAAEEGARPEETTEPVWPTETRDATGETDVTRDVADEDLPDGRVNAARLVSQHPANVVPDEIVYEDFGLGRRAGVTKDLEERTGSPSGLDSPLREESRTADAEGVSQIKTNPIGTDALVSVPVPVQPREELQEGATKLTLRTLDEDAALAHMERVVTVTDGTQGEERETSPDPTPNECEETAADEKNDLGARPRREIVFISAELDALEAGLPPPAAVEKEEYDKELEERLFPLDEVELKKKMVKNAEKEKDLSLEEMSVLLDVPVETLARTRESAPVEQSGPEYWADWYRRTLATSEEAKRANRDFNKEASSTAGTPRVNAVQHRDADWRDVGGGSKRVPEGRPSNNSKASTVTEKSVVGNICVSFAGPAAEVTSRDESTKVPFRLRTLARSVVYQIVLEEEAKGVPCCPVCKELLVLPTTDLPKTTEVARYSALERETRARELIVAAAGVLGDGMMEVLVRRVAELYLAEATSIRNKRTDRETRCQKHSNSSPFPRRVRQRRKVRFDCSSLFAERSEALDSRPSYVEDLNDISHYVCRVRDAVLPRRKPGLVEAEQDDEPDELSDDELRPVPEGKRVICAVGGLEAVSTGYIEDLPAELLIDSGAVASLIDARVLKRLGLANAPLRPYHGSLKDVSGGNLRIKGEIELTLRLGTCEELRTFVVVDRLHVHAILGTDTLKAFRAVIDLEETS
ncbi:hypothetical protein PR001_g3842 [Phytophthora rubi]|uniref:Uncharacterized protein n=1 Tax=Phytophthora rubi TaxID=129364 RepID=A0A6A3P778_9STRA|nr:hypothetical protein PR002_g3804 [Phytophthora rubi]KAE9048356.1 hypothetical protein PR001_g3842 [Phytophthora rubi]